MSSILVTIRPDHCPDPGVRSGSRSGSGITATILLAGFGGGLCSLSTSSCFYEQIKCLYVCMYVHCM